MISKICLLVTHLYLCYKSRFLFLNYICRLSVLQIFPISLIFTRGFPCYNTIFRDIFFFYISPSARGINTYQIVNYHYSRLLNFHRSRFPQFSYRRPFLISIATATTFVVYFFSFTHVEPNPKLSLAIDFGSFALDVRAMSVSWILSVL